MSTPETPTPRTLTAVPDLPPFYKAPVKPNDKLEMVELRYSAVPGQPSIIWWESNTDTVVSICPVPQVGLVSVMLDTLNYVAIVHQPKSADRPAMDKDQAAKYIELAANQVDLGELAPVGAEDVTYKLALDSTPMIDAEGGVGFRGILCVPVTSELFKMNLQLLMTQGLAAKRIAESMEPQAPNQTTH